MNPKIKNAIWLLVILGVALAGYKFLIVNNQGGTPAIVRTDNTDAASREIALTLERLATLKIDKTIFSDELFLSLEDFSLKVVPEEIGRENPFIPFEPEPEVRIDRPPSLVR